jgi:hypothetical protein
MLTQTHGVSMVSPCVSVSIGFQPAGEISGKHILGVPATPMVPGKLEAFCLDDHHWVWKEGLTSLGLETGIDAGEVLDWGLAAQVWQVRRPLLRIVQQPACMLSVIFMNLFMFVFCFRNA